MTITVMFITAAIVAGSTKIVLFEKQSAAHQLNRLHSNSFVTDEYTIIYNEDISMREFIEAYKYFMTITCLMLWERPTIRKYRSRKGYMT